VSVPKRGKAMRDFQKRMRAIYGETKQPPPKTPLKKKKRPDEWGSSGGEGMKSERFLQEDRDSL